MFDSKKNLLIIGGLLILISSLVYFFMKNKNSNVSNAKNGVESEIDKLTNEEISKIFPMGVPSEFGEEDSVLESENLLNYNEFADKLKSGEINFVWEVWKLRRLCPDDFKPDQCNDVILKHIDKSYTPPDNEQLKSLFKDYFRYEVAIRDLELPPTNKFEEKYELIKKKRQEILRDENSKLIFGMEEAKVEFLSLQKDFLETSKKLSGEDRVKGYEALKKKTYGSFYENMKSREDTYTNYQNEISLREDDLKKLSPEAQASQTKAIQEKYFGKEGAERIQKSIEEASKEDKKIQDYEKKEAEFLSQNSGLNPKDKEDKLQEIRVNLLGKEEADAYVRRKELEEALNKIK
jgi:hypothetical protein